MDAIGSLTTTSGTTGTTPVSPILVGPSASAQPTSGSTTPTDSVHISPKGTQASKYVAEASAIAPLNPEVVKHLKAAIAKGSYPAPALVEGLINLVGDGFTAS